MHKQSTLLKSLTAISIGLAFATSASAEPFEHQDPEQIQMVVEDFLYDATSHFDGEARINVQMPKTDRLTACQSIEPFLASERALRSRTRVGVKCYTPKSWTTYVSAEIEITGEYPVLNRVLPAGSVIGPGDIEFQSGDLIRLPNDAATTLDQVLGTITKRRLTPNQPIRLSGVRGANSIARGQPVRLVVTGSGFRIQGEAVANEDGEMGAMIAVRTSTGQTVSGVVLDRNTVAIEF